MALAAQAAAEPSRRQGRMSAEMADSFWRSLHYFSLYRLVVAAVFLGAFLTTGGAANLGAENGALFQSVAWAYLVASFCFLFVLRRVHRGFDLQLTAQVACDVLALVALMYASGGAKSGIAVMLVVVVAGAGLVGQGRLTIFYAALAALAVLGEQSLRMVRFDAESENLFRTGLLSTGFFATAIIARMLAQRVVANEALARQRGIELAAQIRINQQVIRDMDDGILVVDAAGGVRLHNPQAEALLGVPARDGAPLADYSAALAAHLTRRQTAGESSEVVQVAATGKSLLVRALPSGEGGHTLIYLQDLGRAQAQARQIKLAALGRLTANMAHEIRNPLGAISHAAELIADEQREEGRQRLVRIIGDNAARLNRLVGEVLELGRRDRAQPENIPLGAFVRQFVEEYALHHPGVRERVRLSITEGLAICFDRTHLHRVLENLLTNALRYASAAAGAVAVEVRLAGPQRVELGIADDGPGVPEADRGKVFEPFFTTRGGGTGLGLYIARELCDANGAHLELEDSASGAHFCIVAKEGSCQVNPSVERAAT